MQIELVSTITDPAKAVQALRGMADAIEAGGEFELVTGVKGGEPKSISYTKIDEQSGSMFAPPVFRIGAWVQRKE